MLTPTLEANLRRYLTTRRAMAGDDDQIVGMLTALLAEVDRLRADAAAQRKRADDWADHAATLRCPKCTHPWGPIGTPRGLAEEGYAPVWTCPCDCHADVAALKAENAALRAAALVSVLSPGTRLGPVPPF